MTDQVADSQVEQPSDITDNQVDTGSEEGAAVETRSSWLDSIVSDELRTNKSISNFKDVDNLAKGYINLEKKLGSPNPDPVETAQAHSVEDYSVEIPEGNEHAESILGAVKDKAAERGVHPKALKEMSSAYFGSEAEILNSIKQEQESKASESREHAQALLKEEWGDSFEDKMNLADSTWQKFAPKEYDEMLNSLDPAGKSAIARVMANIGESIGEPQIGKQGNSLTNSKESIQNRINELSGSEAYNRGERETVDEVFNLYSSLNSTG